MSRKESEKPRSSKQDTVSDSSENVDDDDSKKQKKPKRSSLSEPHDESYHTALDEVPSDGAHESQIEEPKSQYMLQTVEKTRSSISRKPSQQDKDSQLQVFRSSLSLHNLQVDSQRTLPRTIEERDEAAQEADAPTTLQHKDDQLRRSESSPDTVRASIVKMKPLATQVSTTDVNVGHETLLREGVSTIERQNLFKDQSVSSIFRTNLEPGHAFVYMVLPPDGGYGWVIVLVSFLVQTIVDGIIFSIGITLPYMADDFQVGKSQIIFVSAVQICFYYLSGPITSAIISRYGFRIVAMSGATLSFIFLSIASFSPNLEMMLIFYSALGGPSMSMIWVTSQLIVGYYFDKYRPIASGLSCSGVGSGIVIFVLMNSNLIPIIGWRNVTRIHASLMIIVFLLSFAFLEVAPSKIGIIREAEPILTDGSDSSGDELEVKTYIYGEPSTSHDVTSEFLTLDKIHTQDLEIYKPKKRGRCTECCRRCCACGRETAVSDADDDETRGGPKRYVIKTDLIERQDLYYTGPAEYTEHDKAVKRELIDGQDVELIEEKKPVEAINYVFSMHAPRRSLSEERRHRKCVTIPSKLKRSFAILFDFKLFRIMEFQVLFASAFLFGLAFNIPFLFSKERLDLPPGSARMIPMIIGCATFGSRILCGLIAYKFRKHVVYLCGGAVTFGGSMVLLSAFYGHDLFWFQALYAILFGFAPAFFSTLRAIIYVQYLGLENLTNAFGLIGMGMGSSVFMGTVIGGVLNDVTGGYVASFTFAGLCIIGSGILKLILSPLSRRGQKARKVKFQV